MRQRSIEIPKVVEVSAGCHDRLPDLLSEAFDTSRVCVGSGCGPSRPIADRIASVLAGAGAEVERVDDLRGTLDDAARVGACAGRRRATLMIGVGGGRAIDSVKLAAARTGVDFLSVPTAVSHDGISSPVASLTDTGHVRRSYAAAMPAGIVIDLAVIGSAPARTLRAGAGDLLSNLVAILDWELAAERGHETFDAFSSMIAEKAARSVIDVEDLASRESHDALAKGLLLSGLAMAAAGTSRPCSGAEHLISHSLDALLGPRAALHGEQVALGCLISAAAHDSPHLETLTVAFERLGLPRRPADVGITVEELEQAVLRAPATRPERFTVLTELVAAGGDRVPKLIERTFDKAPA